MTMPAPSLTLKARASSPMPGANRVPSVRTPSTSMSTSATRRAFGPKLLRRVTRPPGISEQLRAPQVVEVEHALDPPVGAGDDDRGDPTGLHQAQGAGRQLLLRNGHRLHGHGLVHGAVHRTLAPRASRP